MKLQRLSLGVVLSGLLGALVLAQDPTIPTPPPPAAGDPIHDALQSLNSANSKVNELRRKLSKDNQEVAAVDLKIADVDRQSKELRTQRDTLEQQITDILCRDPEFKVAYDQLQAAKQQFEDLKKTEMAKRKDGKRAAKDEGAPKPEKPRKKDKEGVPPPPPPAM